MKERLALLAACAVVGASSASAWAVGAIAVGSTGNIADDGLAIGFSYNQANREAAHALALKECQAFPDAPQNTRRHCRVIHTFERECISVALDPEAGTPGWGWGVARTTADADEQSMRMCRSTAGANRERFCKVLTRRCDQQ